ncbi:MAG TPA: M56 family metallopeptidase, partial [Longimicrobium sp.]|nr:M56 family metallopeptidase [Longimicrobium sp.]
LHRRALLRRTEPVDGRTAAFARRIVGEAGIRRTVRVRRGPVPVPVTWGTLRPVILLPESAAAWDDARLKPVLRHEIAHVARLDALGRMVAQAACGVLWFHPLAWHGARRLAAEQEHAADDAVLRAGAEPAEYAQALLRMARDARGGLRPAGAIPAAHPSRLEGRLLAILDPERRAAPPRRGSAALASLAVALVLAPVAAATPGAEPVAGSAAVQPDSGRIRAEWRVDGTRMEAIIRGDVRISEEPERIRVPAGGLLTVEEVAVPGARRLAVHPGPGGAPAVAWTVGGQPAPLDAEARAWLRPWLRHVAAELRFAAARDTLDRERQALRAAPRPASVPEAERRRVLAQVDAVARRRRALSEMPPGTPEQGVARDLLRLQLTREEMRLLASIGMAP